MRSFNDLLLNFMIVTETSISKDADNPKHASAAVKPEVANTMFAKFFVPKIPAITLTAKLPSRAIPIEAMPKTIKNLIVIAPISSIDLIWEEHRNFINALPFLLFPKMQGHCTGSFAGNQGEIFK